MDNLEQLSYMPNMAPQVHKKLQSYSCIILDGDASEAAREDAILNGVTP